MNYDQYKLMSDRDEVRYADDELYNADVELFLETMGAEDVTAEVDSKNETVDIGFTCEGIYYYVNDLCQKEYYTMTLNDFIKEADDSETACCGARYDSDHRRCHHCQEAF